MKYPSRSSSQIQSCVVSITSCSRSSATRLATRWAASCSARRIAGGQSFQVVLEDVVGGSAAQRLDRPLLAQGSGDEYERNLRRFARGDLEGGEPVKLRKGKSQRE